MQTIVERLFEHVREIDAGLNVGGIAELAGLPSSQVETLALALGHLHDRVQAVLRVRMYPAQGNYHDRSTNGASR